MRPACGLALGLGLDGSTPFGLSRAERWNCRAFSAGTWPSLASSFRDPSRKRGDLRHQCVDQRILLLCESNERSGPADIGPVDSDSPPSRHLFPTPESIRRTCHAKSAGG